MTKAELKSIKEVISHCRFERASFSHIVPSLDPPEMALPQSEQEVDRFIKARTRLYMASWVIPQLEAIIAKYERRT